MSKGGPFSKLGASVGELERAVEERIKDSASLLGSERFASSIASGLYALEIQLKIVICRRLDVSSLPKLFQIHDLEDLLILTGLSKHISHVRRPRHLKKSWDGLMDLPEVDRFRYDDRPGWDEALATRVHALLLDTKSGVIPWLRKQALKKSR